MITLVKLGGSLITDKNRPRHFRASVVQRIASDIKTVTTCTNNPEHKLIIGHGSGSFGHIEAKKYNTIHSVNSTDDWLGFTKVAHAASALSQLVLSEFIKADVPAFRVQPSASITAYDGQVQEMNTVVIRSALNHDLIPLIHGDVAYDEIRGGTIVSTETIFSYLVQELDISRIILLGEVDGVFDSEGQVIDHITPASFEFVKSALGGSGGVDVTGGMIQKVLDMLTLVRHKSDLNIIIANGTTPNMLVDLICNDQKLGTTISS